MTEDPAAIIAADSMGPTDRQLATTHRPEAGPVAATLGAQATRATTATTGAATTSRRITVTDYD